MQQNFNFYLGIFIITLVLSFTLVFLLRRISERYSLYDLPNSRKIHSKPIPRIGGLGIFISFLAVNFALFLLMPSYYQIGLGNNNIIYLFFVSLIIFSLGFFDDIYKVSPFPRLFIQAISSIFLWSHGLSIKIIDFSHFFNQESFWHLPDFLSLIITFLWISGIINCINWLDGLDGLCAGTTFIILISFGLISFFSQNNFSTIICLTLIASILGFWLHNKYPAKITMGDGGSNFIGFLISLLGIISFQREYNQDYVVNLVLPSLILFIPLMDMVVVIIRRMKNSKFRIFFPDNNHIHHRLLKVGFSHPRTVRILLFTNLISIIFVTSFSIFKFQNIYIIFTILFFLYFSLTRLRV